MTDLDPLNERLTDVFRQVFDNEELELSDATVASDVEGWDSLNHVKLVVAIEEAFGVKFSNREIGGWENVGDVRRSLAKKVEG